MTARIKLLGRRFERLVVLREGAPGDPLCVVQYDCGVEKIVNRRDLLAGDAKSCRPTSVGDVFGFWTIVSEAPRNAQRNRMMNARCVCGVISIVPESALTAGLTKPCRTCRSKVKVAA